jgi:hypothetical protein
MQNEKQMQEKWKQFAIVDRMRNNSQTPTQVKKESALQNNEWNAMLK